MYILTYQYENFSQFDLSIYLVSLNLSNVEQAYPTYNDFDWFYFKRPSTGSPVHSNSGVTEVIQRELIIRPVKVIL